MTDELVTFDGSYIKTGKERIVIPWKGKIGYGDIISPICYAHNLADKHTMDVDLVFRWPHGPDHKFHEDDPETLMERADYIARWVRPSLYQRVNVSHEYDQEMKHNHENYVDDGPCHNTRFHQQRTALVTEQKRIVVVHSMNNKEQFQDYDPGKTWKDPLGCGPNGTHWPMITRKLSNMGYQLHEIDYRTPIEKAVSTMQRAWLLIGYHGSATWLGKFMGMPMVIFSKHKRLTPRSFPWAIVIGYSSDFNINMLSTYRQKSIDMMRMHEEELNGYYIEPHIRGIRSVGGLSLSSVQTQHPFQG